MTARWLFPCTCIGLDLLRSEIDFDHRSAPINSLCQSIEGKVCFFSLLSAVPLDDITEMFAVMMSVQSTLFQDIWRKHMKNAAASVKQKKRAELTIEDIRIVIWDKTFQECNYLLDSLHDRSIKLFEVDSYFKSIQQQELVWQLKRLNAGVVKCVRLDESHNLLWIDGVVKHIHDYWSLLELSKAARVVIQLKTKLCLTGDFKAIDTLANEVKSDIVITVYTCWTILYHHSH